MTESEQIEVTEVRSTLAEHERGRYLKGLEAGFADASVDVPERYRPKLISNDKTTGTNLLEVIKYQLRRCDSFDFCVAFVGESGLQPLVEVLAELKRRGIRGRLLTSTYLNFNTPATFRKLLEYDNIEVRVYQGNLHAKGYVFDRDGVSTVIVGSSNLTQMALTCNREWNVLFRSFGEGEMLLSVKREYGELWESEQTECLSPEWIDRYEVYRATESAPTARKAAFQDEKESPVEHLISSIKPNKMQETALESLEVLHGREEPRALLVSATGTGKTYLSAFDVLEVKPRKVLFLAHRRRILTASMASYQKVLGSRYTYGIFEPGQRDAAPTCVFAMCSTLVNHLDELRPDEFDYVIIDEAHRVGAAGYQKIINYLTPKFCLGMTATPNRTDGYDVFALFNHVIAFRISLQDALANDMLAPFHYFGIADVEIDDETVDSNSPELFNRLTSDERVRHITEKIEEYTVDKANRRGLIFCNRNEEAAELSRRFNELGYRTCALSGADSDEVRNRQIARLESGELEYIFSVDILNEGVDIPSVNQIIMLRRTDSAIVFVQQLGRGLRKDEDSHKEYALVLDFIGNYQQNFLVPVALSGDRTYNKDNLRAIVKEGSSVIPGCSTVSFDRVSEQRIYKAIDGGDFTSAKRLKEGYQELRQVLGHIPTLLEFDENDALDPLLIFKKYGSYHSFLARYENDYGITFTSKEESVLKFLSQKLASGKRAEELFMLRELLGAVCATSDELVAAACEINASVRPTVLKSAENVLNGGFSGNQTFVPLVILRDGVYELTDEFLDMLTGDKEFFNQVYEVVDFGLSRYKAQYRNAYEGTSFVLYQKYTYEEVCYLLNWDKNVNGQNIGGYKYDQRTNTFPVFINYDKDPDIADTIRYEDRFVSESRLIAISKQPRHLDSPEIQRLREWPGNGMKTYLFVRKNKDDKISKEFYFLGEMHPVGEYEEITMTGTTQSAVEITYELNTPVEHNLYEYLTSSIEDEEEQAS